MVQRGRVINNVFILDPKYQIKQMKLIIVQKMKRNMIAQI